MQQPSQDEQRNLILAAVLSFAVIVLWQVFFIDPQIEAERSAQDAAREAAIEAGVAPPQAAALDTPSNAGSSTIVPLDTALGESDRVAIDSDHVRGSIALTGGLFDQLELKDYRVTIDDDSPLVELLWPRSTINAYYARYGWSVVGGGHATPSSKSVWRQESGRTLAPGRPIVLAWDNGGGLVFRRRIEIDDNYLFTVTQSVENNTDAPISLAPYAAIYRHGVPPLTGFFVLHEGAVGVLNGELQEVDYDDFVDFEQPVPGRLYQNEIDATPGGWLGFTDKYWLTAIAPVGEQNFKAYFKEQTTQGGRPVFSTEALFATQTVGAGETAAVESRLFAGAKELETLKDYQYLFDGASRPDGFFGRLNDFFFYTSQSRFTDAIDWGWFFFLTKPIFEVLNWINSIVGNMGVSIILLTLLIKTLLFPLAYKSFVSMSKLKKLQPEIKKIQERAGEDKMKMQQEMMALYKKERVNPAAGCLPILAQIPIFFSLYKVLFVTLEVRQAPFFGWIQDLSAPDPTSILNLFGALPWETPGPQSFFFIFSIGVWPIVMGFTMWIQQMLNPAPTDPMQEKIFNLLPLMFMFLLGSFASGLVIYWTANNVLTIIQQYVIMRSQGVDVNIVQNMKRQLGLAPKEGAT